MGERHRWTEADKEEIGMAAAYLAHCGQAQEEIAAALGISQPEVSRLLKQARDKKWIGPPAFPGRENEPEVWDRAQRRFFSSSGNLLESLRGLGSKRLLRRLSVYPSDARGDFTPAVVAAIEQLVPRVRVLGVTWGRTISGLLKLLEDHYKGPLRKEDPIQFVPLCGEPLKDRKDPYRYSSSVLVEELDRLLNGPGSPRPLYSLAGVPAFIPTKGFSADQVATILRFLRQVDGYAAVFGAGEEASGHRRGLAFQVDTILTSLGVRQPPNPGIFLSERVAIGDITDQELDKWVVGDIGGVLVGRPGLRGRGDKIEQLNARWTGLKRAHLERCAQAAIQDDSPGVVVLARGEGRAEMVRRCCELDLVNELIVEKTLFDALEKSFAGPGADVPHRA